MMRIRQFYILKFNSKNLKMANYNLKISFEEAKKFGEVVKIADNQFLRSIRDIKNKNISYETIDQLFMKEIF